VDGPVGSHDRTHHHPGFRGWEPGRRKYDEQMTKDPVRWLTGQLADLPALLAGAELDPDVAGPDDARQLAEAAPAIAAVVGEMLAGVRAGELGRPVEASEAAGARGGWL
jgi:hypothetical protein